MPQANQFPPDRLIWMFTQMVRIREFEERVKRTFIEHPGVIRGHTHLGDGAEASMLVRYQLAKKMISFRPAIAATVILSSWARLRGT